MGVTPEAVVLDSILPGLLYILPPFAHLTGLINPSRPLTPGEEAGLKRRALRQPSPQAMTDQAQQFLPQMPPPQAPPPVAQAPANPDTRAQFAAMYPNDITSSLIRTQQGIGSLLS